MNFVNTGISVVHRSTKSQVYPLIFGSQNVPVYCHMGSFGCGEGGWTLAMKIDGKKVCYFAIKEYHCCKLYTTITFLFSTFQKTFHYDSKFWINKNIYNLPGGKTGLTQRRPNYRPTGTHPSPRYASVWKSTNSSGLLSSTSRQALSTHWSLMENTATLHWVATRGRSWSAHNPPYRPTVTRKASMLRAVPKAILKQELVFLEIMKNNADLLIPESALEREDITMTPSLVEIMQ